MNRNKLSITNIGIYILILLWSCFCASLLVLYLGGIEYVIPIPYTNERLKTLNNVDQIQILIFFPPNYEPVYTKTITDPEEINAIVEKVRTYADNWILPTFHYFSFPQPPVQVAFAREGEIELLEAFFIGDRNGFPFITALPGGKYLSANEFKELTAVLKVDENCARLSRANQSCNTDGFEEEPPFIPPEGY